MAVRVGRVRVSRFGSIGSVGGRVSGNRLLILMVETERKGESMHRSTRSNVLKSGGRNSNIVDGGSSSSIDNSSGNSNNGGQSQW